MFLNNFSVNKALFDSYFSVFDEKRCKSTIFFGYMQKKL